MEVSYGEKRMEEQGSGAAEMGLMAFTIDLYWAGRNLLCGGGGGGHGRAQKVGGGGWQNGLPCRDALLCGFGCFGANFAGNKECRGLP